MTGRAILAAALLATLPLAATADGQPAPASPVGTLSEDLAHGLTPTVPDGFSVAAVGDVILTHPIAERRDPGFRATLEWLKASDVAFGNLEETLGDPRAFGGQPAFTEDSLRPTGEAAVAKDLRTMGFGLVSRANNHTTDWGAAGMRATDAALDAAGLAHAGSGEDRAAARAPRYLNAERGRIGLVSITTTFEDGQPALPPYGLAPPRAGSSALRTTRKVIVDREAMAALRRLAASLPAGSVDPPAAQGPLRLLGTVYQEGPKPGFTYDVDATDQREFLRAVRQGKLNSDLLIVNIHSHEPGNWSDPPAPFLLDLAHAAIDAGADIIVCEGPHHLRGVEVYKGRPIFYSLGNYLFTMSSAEPVGADIAERLAAAPEGQADAEFNESRVGIHIANPDWYRGVVAVTVYRGGRAAEIQLHPIELDLTARMADRGVPHAATGPEASAILDRLARLSAPFGTHIEIRGGMGIIRLGEAR
jgi:poly-gamma-glutamate synthesis protein (capsule biosynthesis protein)